MYRDPYLKRNPPGRQHLDSAFTYAKLLTQDDWKAADAVYEASICCRVSRFPAEKQETGLLRAVRAQIFINQKGSSDDSSTIELAPVEARPPVPSGESLLKSISMLRENPSLIAMVLPRLSFLNREALVLHEVLGIKYSGVAEITGASMPIVGFRIMCARKEMVAQLLSEV
jgi:DNA-directed RNA polymerase specialized sigma24 family protein